MCAHVFLEYFFNPFNGFSYKLCILRPTSDLELFSKIQSHLDIVLKCASAFYIKLCRSGMLMVQWSAMSKNIYHWQALPF